MGKLKDELTTFCKAQFSAQFATLADYAVTIILTEWCSMWYVAATTLGALTGGCLNCAANYQWVFCAQGQDKWLVAAKYCMVWCGSIMLNSSGTYLLTELLHLHYIIAKTIVAVGVAVLWNYQLQKRFVYHHIT